MVFEAAECQTCGGIDIQRQGQSSTGKKRYIYLNSNSTRKTFILNYAYQGDRPEVKWLGCIRKDS
ncbi:hypothetical protein Pse7429DRAFT_1545 [Pseudanabaena biceps PCC 7429]|uniref:Uncharacterized protein n=1 Tax=Pseudanabaena biceps PCC 7429 TaxID=927668 RepID=L8N2P2_9CYAN|nr:hypothetical protein Pse7429DRAFT_1545 [Pseudanabaena biceps PCC 7429]